MNLKKVPILLIVLFTGSFFLSSIACEKNFGQQMLYNKGRNLHDHGHIDEAIEVYKKVIEMDGDHSEVIYDLGVAYADKGDTNNAKKQVVVLREAGRGDLADVLNTVIKDSNSSRLRKKLQSDFDAKKDINND